MMKDMQDSATQVGEPVVSFYKGNPGHEGATATQTTQDNPSPPVVIPVNIHPTRPPTNGQEWISAKEEITSKGFACGVLYALLIITIKTGISFVEKEPAHLWSLNNLIIMVTVPIGITLCSFILGVWADIWDKRHPHHRTENPARRVFNVIPGVLVLIRHLKVGPLQGLAHEANDPECHDARTGGEMFQDRSGASLVARSTVQNPSLTGYGTIRGSEIIPLPDINRNASEHGAAAISMPEADRVASAPQNPILRVLRRTADAFTGVFSDPARQSNTEREPLLLTLPQYRQ